MAQDFTEMAQTVLGFFFAGGGVMDEQPLMLNSAPQVALELLKIIADRESKQRIEKPDARTYYLTLYRQCLKAVSGNPLEDVLAES
jgi:hypothetical protein